MHYEIKAVYKNIIIEGNPRQIQIGYDYYFNGIRVSKKTLIKKLGEFIDKYVNFYDAIRNT